MKFILLLLAVVEVACNNVCKDMPIIGYAAIEKEKGRSLAQTIELRRMRFQTELNASAGISGRDSVKSSIQLNVYTTLATSENARLFHLERSGETWAAKEVSYRLDYSAPLQDTIVIQINAIRNLTPRIPWQTIIDSLQRFGLFTLYGDDSLKGYSRSMDNKDVIDVVFSDGIKTNSYTYHEIESNRKFPEVAMLHTALAFIDRNFIGGDYIFRSCAFKQ